MTIAGEQLCCGVSKQGTLAGSFLRLNQRVDLWSLLFMRSRNDRRPNWTVAPEFCWLVLPTGSTDCLPVSILGTPRREEVDSARRLPWTCPAHESRDSRRRSSPAPRESLRIDPRGRSPSFGFYFIHSRHEQDFCESKAMNRVLRDLEHKRLILMDARVIAVCLPDRDRPKFPTQ